MSAFLVGERSNNAVDAVCDLALTVRSEGIMDDGDLIGNRHIGAIASEGSGDAICDIADNLEPKYCRLELITVSGP